MFVGSPGTVDQLHILTRGYVAEEDLVQDELVAVFDEGALEFGQDFIEGRGELDVDPSE